jgi:hypothetical protein
MRKSNRRQKNSSASSCEMQGDIDVHCLLSRAGSQRVVIKQRKSGTFFFDDESIHVDDLGRGHYWGPSHKTYAIGVYDTLETALREARTNFSWLENSATPDFISGLKFGLTEILRIHDPEHLIADGAPNDEYAFEAIKLADSIRPDTSEADLTQVIAQFWAWSYGARHSVLLGWYQNLKWEEPISASLQTLVTDIFALVQRLISSTR